MAHLQDPVSSWSLLSCGPSPSKVPLHSAPAFPAVFRLGAGSTGHCPHSLSLSLSSFPHRVPVRLQSCFRTILSPHCPGKSYLLPFLLSQPLPPQALIWLLSTPGLFSPGTTVGACTGPGQVILGALHIEPLPLIPAGSAHSVPVSAWNTVLRYMSVSLTDG